MILGVVCLGYYGLMLAVGMDFSFIWLAGGIVLAGGGIWMKFAGTHGIHLPGAAPHHSGGGRAHQQRGPGAHRVSGFCAAARKNIRKARDRGRQRVHRHSGRQSPSFFE